MWTAGDWDDFSRHLVPVGMRLLERIGSSRGWTSSTWARAAEAPSPSPRRRPARTSSAATSRPSCSSSAAARGRGGRGRRVGRGRRAGTALRRCVVRSGDLDVRRDVRARPPARGSRARAGLPAGRHGAMATWANEGFAGGFFELSGLVHPAAPARAFSRRCSGVARRRHAEMFAAAGAQAGDGRARPWCSSGRPSRRSCAEYESEFGPMVTRRGTSSSRRAAGRSTSRPSRGLLESFDERSTAGAHLRRVPLDHVPRLSGLGSERAQSRRRPCAGRRRGRAAARSAGAGSTRGR